MSDRVHIADGDVDTTLVAEYERSRRELVRRGIAIGGVAVAASAIPFFLRIRNAFAQAEGDAAVLEAAIGLEQQAVFAYTAAADSGKLGESGVGRAAVRRAGAGARGRPGAGAAGPRRLPPPAGPTSAGDVPGLAEAVGGNAADITNFAIELETMAVAAYYDAQAKLRAPELLATAASIMANEAQHLVVLRQALGRNPSPRAFVTGGS